jgi:hypothetical protein
MYAYAITPKESVQRVKDVLGVQQARNTALSIGLGLGLVNIKQALEQLKDAEEVAGAIERQPVIVGYGVGVDASGRVNRFGWLLGPRVHVGTKKEPSVMRQYASQNPLTALLSMPGWWRSAEFRVKSSWINDKGETVQTNSELVLPVELPGDVSEITPLLTGDQRDRGPSARVEREFRYTLGRKAQILIRGVNLWRNPVVSVGTQVADHVETLPNMGGVVAQFNELHDNETGSKLKEELRDVWIWTSEGAQQAGWITVVRQVPVPSKKSKIAVE